jgi:hypothetical protein
MPINLNECKEIINLDLAAVERRMIMNIKYKLADHMRNSMHMPNDMLEHLDCYYLKHLHVPEFKNALVDGQVFMYGHNFNVIYHQCTPAAAKAAKEIRLSFRKAKPEFNIEPYVLVQIVSME